MTTNPMIGVAAALVGAVHDGGPGPCGCGCCYGGFCGGCGHAGCGGRYRRMRRTDTPPAPVSRSWTTPPPVRDGR